MTIYTCTYGYESNGGTNPYSICLASTPAYGIWSSIEYGCQCTKNPIKVLVFCTFFLIFVTYILTYQSSNTSVLQSGDCSNSCKHLRSCFIYDTWQHDDLHLSARLYVKQWHKCSLLHMRCWRQCYQQWNLVNCYQLLHRCLINWNRYFLSNNKLFVSTVDTKTIVHISLWKSAIAKYT